MARETLRFELNEVALAANQKVYVTLSQGGREVFRSEVRHSAHPVWNETAMIPMDGGPVDCIVWEKHTFSKDKEVCHQLLHPTTFTGTLRHEIPMNDRHHGNAQAATLFATVTSPVAPAPAPQAPAPSTYAPPQAGNAPPHPTYAAPGAPMYGAPGAPMYAAPGASNPPPHGAPMYAAPGASYPPPQGAPPASAPAYGAPPATPPAYGAAPASAPAPVDKNAAPPGYDFFYPSAAGTSLEDAKAREARTSTAPTYQPYSGPAGSDFHSQVSPYAQPVQPEPAYPNQPMPPPYLFSPPPNMTVPADGKTYEGPPNYYAVPPDYQAPPYAPPPFTVLQGNAPPAYTFSAPPPPANYAPQPEVTLALPGNSFKTTSVPMTVDPATVSHLNLYNNDIERITDLHMFPNLMRLTLGTNNLKSLAGIEQAPYLRWVDVSNNDVVDFRGMGSFSAVEWLDISTNDVVSFAGFASAPYLTWVNAMNNNIKSCEGIEAISACKVLNLEHNDLRTARGLERLPMLQELNLKSNDLRDVDSILALANLPHLYRIDLRDNDFKVPQREQIRDYFARYKPNCQVIQRL